MNIAEYLHTENEKYEKGVEVEGRWRGEEEGEEGKSEKKWLLYLIFIEYCNSNMPGSNIHT